MTTFIARQPLHPLPMSSVQRFPRRLSARLQEKDDAQHLNGTQLNTRDHRAVVNGAEGAKLQKAAESNARKRKINYDEEDDGFIFTRVKKKKPKNAEANLDPVTESTKESARTKHATVTESRTSVPINQSDNAEPSKKRPTKMSFSTPSQKEQQPVRRSKRLSSDADPQHSSPQHKARRKDDNKTAAGKVEEVKRTGSPKRRKKTPEVPDHLGTQAETVIPDGHSATQIALPFADTPVIRRNKAMREGKGGKGERRSSLGMRGRRASSLIDSGSSSALPHHEVDISDFYKHIESEGLPEPRRMKQLLTWCATRALDSKPIGTDFEDASARSAARVIEEELLKDLANRSELSDWFNRDDPPVQTAPLPERPNPKNIQNAEKIIELEEQIKRLRAQRDALEALQRPPSIPEIPPDTKDGESQISTIDRSLLSEEDAAVLASVTDASGLHSDIANRLNSLFASLGPTVDAFADGVHQIAQYRNAAENVAGRALAICSEKLADRDKEGRKKALQKDEARSPRKDLNSVLRGLSRVDR